MTSGAVIALIRELEHAGCRCWVDGGWGVDALLGHQTREHADLDLVVGDDHLLATVDHLKRAGYVVVRDWLPTAIALRRQADGNEVDLHPVRRTADGGGDQVQLDGVSLYHYGPPVPGSIAGATVLCCSVDDQIRGHLGYEPTEMDHQDVTALAETFDLVLPEPYAKRGLGPRGPVDVEVVVGPQWPQDVERLLRALPEWFGIESSVMEYVESAHELPTLAAVREQEVVGICLLRRHNPAAAEIELLAVRRDLHRHGIGRRLVEELETDLRAHGVKLLQVKTLGPSGGSVEYERTRAFYEALGFIPLEERTDIWDPGNPCLFLVKPLIA